MVHLELGDLILIESNEEYLNNQIFKIQYIDVHLIEIVNEDTDEPILLKVNDGVFEDRAIRKVFILKRNNEKGFILQNNLNVYDWLDIRFMGMSKVITGQVTGIEHDMIEFEIYPNVETIYIDFGYKGIPKTIDKIVKREKPDTYNEQQNEQQNEENQNENKFDSPLINNFEDNVETDNDNNNENDNMPAIVESDSDSDSDLEEFVEYVEVAEEDKRYDIDVQKENLMNDMLSYLPEHSKTYNKLKELQRVVDRFEELVLTFSNDNVTNNYLSENPLKTKISSLHLPNWILPVVKNKKYLFSSGDIKSDYYDDIQDVFVVENDQQKTLDTTFTFPLFEDAIVSGPINKSTDVVMSTHSVSKKEKYFTLTRSKDTVFRYISNDKASIIGFLVKPLENILHEYQYLPQSLVHKKCNIFNNFYKSKPNHKKSICFESTCDLFSFDNINKPVVQRVRKEDKNIIIDNDNVLELYVEHNVPELSDQIRSIQPYIPFNDSLTLYSIINEYGILSVESQHINTNIWPYLKKYIESNVSAYEKKIKENQKQSFKLKSFKNKVNKQNVIFDILTNTEQEKIFDLYEINEISQSLSEEEMYEIFTQLDGGNVLTMSYALQDMDIYTDMNIHEVAKQKIETLQNKTLSNSKCRKKIVAKEYKSIEELEFDNNKDILFDFEYEKAYLSYIYSDQYDMIMDILHEKEGEMLEDEYKTYVYSILNQYTNLEPTDLEYESGAIVSEQRFVRDGFYAILRTPSNELDKYYERTDGQWQLNTSIDPLEEENLFCIANSECSLTSNLECDSLDNIKDKMEKSAVEQIYQNIVSEQQVEVSQLKDNLQQTFNQMAKKIQKHIQILKNKRQTQVRTSNIVKDQIKSPFIPIKSYILQQSFSKKMEYLKIFMKVVTRKAIQKYEDKHWLYCIKTNSPLLPSFYVDLVKASNISANEYDNTLRKIIDERGVLEGDTWIDKYSNEKISNIRYTQDNEYYSSVIVSNVEGSFTHSNTSEISNIKQDRDTLLIKNIFEYFTEYIGVNIANKIPELTKHVFFILKKNHGSFKQFYKYYKNSKGKSIDKEKAQKLYIKIKNQYILLSSGLLYLIAVQTTIPNAKPRVSFPNCKKSFSGFPMYKNDFDGLKYMRCVLKTTAISDKKNNAIWKSIYDMKESKIEATMKDLYNKNIADIQSINNWIQRKKKYDSNHTEDIIESQLIWHSFQPNLLLKSQKEHSNVEYFRESFYQNVNSQLKNGNEEQQSLIDYMKTKMRRLVNEIQYEIYNITNKEKVLLYTGNREPYMQNICCQNNIINHSSCIQYFKDKTPNIGTHMNEIQKVEEFINNYIYTQLPLYEYSHAEEVPDMLSNQNWTKQSIYFVFFKICLTEKYSHLIDKNIRDKVQSLYESVVKAHSGDKNSDETMYYYENIMLRHFQSDETVQEKTIIEIIKKIHQKNIVPVISQQKELRTVFNNIEVLATKMLDIEKGDRLYTYSNTFLIKLKAWCSNTKDNATELLNWLLEQNETNVNTARDILRSIPANYKQLRSIQTFFVDIRNKDSELYNYDTKYWKQAIHNLQHVYPSIIHSKNDIFKQYIPKHWRFSQTHSNILLQDTIDTVKWLHDYKNNSILMRVLDQNIFSKNELLDILPESVHVDSISERCLKELYIYLYISYLKDIIESISYETIEQFEDETQVDEIFADYLRHQISFEDEFEMMDEIDQNTIFKTISMYLGKCIESTIQLLKYSNVDSKKIKQEMIYIRNDEKIQMVEELEKTYKNNLDVKNALKNFKQGRYNTTLLKGLREYNPDFFDEEFEQAQQIAEFERQQGTIRGLTMENMKNYRFGYEDMVDQQHQMEEEAERYDMSALGDDDENNEEE